MTTIELLTKNDLEAFKTELLTEMRSLLQQEGKALKKWIKTAEVRELLDISPSTLQNLRVNGTLRFTKVGGTIYYKTEDINKIMESGFADQ